MKEQISKPAFLEKQRSVSKIFNDKMIDACKGTVQKGKCEWKETAFYEVYNNMNGSRFADLDPLSERLGINKTYLSRWIHSSEYQELALMYSRIKHMALVPMAIKTIEELLMDGSVQTKDESGEKGGFRTTTKDNKIKYQIAKDILEKAQIFERSPGEAAVKPSVEININMSEKDLLAELDKKRQRILEITGNE